jgi:superfamily I DNA and/or RNA helicase/very-short-patch-repair endonuclease
VNESKNLILVRNREGKFEDKTVQIVSCYKGSSKYNIIFESKPEMTYEYNYSSVNWSTNPIEYVLDETIIYQGDKIISGIERLLDFGDNIKLFFKKGRKKLYKKDEVNIEKNCLQDKKSKDVFQYLKELSKIIRIENEESNNNYEEETFLSKQYNKINSLSPRSILALYLIKGELKKENNHSRFIFPFGFNISQKEATEKAINNTLSIIEGPPGTGKTQTILNIIANAILHDETVAVVSNNNSAIKNVIEKLEKYKVDFIAAFLGKNENKENFINNQTGLYPDMNNWKLESSDEESLQRQLEDDEKILNEMLIYKNELATLKQELDVMLLEKRYFDEYYNVLEKIDKYSTFYKHSSEIVLSIWAEYQYIIENRNMFKFSNKIKYLIKYGIYSFDFYKNPNEKIIEFLQNLYYEKKIEELNKNISKFSEELEDYSFDEKMLEYSNNSMKLFKSKLCKRIELKSNRKIFSKDDLWKNFDQFIKEYPIILSTTHSLRPCVSGNYLFDYVIIDEASQVDIVSGSLALSCAKKAVIVGDLKQLPNVVNDDTKKKANEIFNKFNLNETYRYSSSLLSSITCLFEDMPKTLLKEHYRCSPKIIGFCNQKFYNDELIVLTDEKEEKPLIAYKTVKGNHARGKYNQRQIDTVFEEIIPNEKLINDNKSIGIISPYRNQTTELQKAIGDRDIIADTVHKFQGKEKDVIILTTVSNEMNNFIDNPNLINVAVSRAVDKLIIVVSGNDEFLGKSSNIGDLIKYIDYNNFEIVESKIYSVFDLLYKQYYRKRLEVLGKMKKISQYDSENLMKIIIDSVLEDNVFSNLSYDVHQPLKMLIKDTSLLDDKEIKFTKNILTHTDFIIFNKLDKRPVLVVEVDGYAFHANNPKQLERDRMKDRILEKYDIPVLRLATNGSVEEVKLKCKLLEILGI